MTKTELKKNITKINKLLRSDSYEAGFELLKTLNNPVITTGAEKTINMCLRKNYFKREDYIRKSESVLDALREGLKLAASLRLETLNLRGMKITALPPEIGLLTTLKKLYLSNNKLSTGIWEHPSIPPEIGKLKELIELDLKKNKWLNELPPEIGNLTKLKILNLDETHIGRLPSEIGKLTNLESISMFFTNEVLMFPPEIKNLNKLKTLNIGYNKISDEMENNLLEWLPHTKVEIW
jgi:Leucine-rich repeat (LRR) protein